MLSNRVVHFPLELAASSLRKNACTDTEKNHWTF